MHVHTYVCIYVSAGKVTIIGGIRSSITQSACMHACKEVFMGSVPAIITATIAQFWLFRSAHAPIYTCIHVFMHTVYSRVA